MERREGQQKRSGEREEVGESSKSKHQTETANSFTRIPRVQGARPKENIISPLTQQKNHLELRQLLVVGIKADSEVAKALEIRGVGMEVQVIVPGTDRVEEQGFMKQTIKMMQQYSGANRIMIVLTPWTEPHRIN